MGDLKSLYILMITYFVTDFFHCYFFAKVLGRKYSVKITIVATCLMWVSDCVLKLFPQYLWGINPVGVINYIMIFTFWVYTFILFQGPTMKKILAMIIYTTIQMGMDMTGLEIAIMITGTEQLFNSELIDVAVCSSGLLLAFGTVAGIWIWKWFESRNWDANKYQWFCFVFPMSQMLLLRYTMDKNISSSYKISGLVLIGLFIGIVADIYMFWLFERMNSKRIMERKVRELKQQYELEKIKYEQVKKIQEETARMRHDFQNYLLVLKGTE